MTDSNKSSFIFKLIPVMLAFFAMGFVDMTGIVSNYVQKDFNLSHTMAGLLPSMVFFWFLVFSVPTGILMNKIGRRKTVLISLAVTLIALIFPFVHYNLAFMLVALSLLGIGNTLMQVSLNPLVSNIVSGDKLASFMTFGQFVKAIASFIAPIIAAWAALRFGNWKLLFPIFALEGLLALIALAKTEVKETQSVSKNSGFRECFALLGERTVLLFFIGIICHVGIDVGTNLTAPKILIERLGWDLTAASAGASIYFLFRTIGCFAGSFLLAKINNGVIFAVSVLLIFSACLGLLAAPSKALIYLCVAMIGLGNANIFPIIFSRAILSAPGKQNEVSGLMIMGLVGGMIFPPVMGAASDLFASQSAAAAVLALGAAYLLFVIKLTFKKE